MLFDSGTSKSERTVLGKLKVQYPSLIAYSYFFEGLSIQSNVIIIKSSFFVFSNTNRKDGKPGQ